jgi:tetratricopeptide (TPR) repeat protein
MPAKVRSTVKGKGLGRILADLKLITEDELRAVQQEMTRSGELQGTILVRRGTIDASDLVHGLREQMLIKLVDVFAMTDASYAFYEKMNMLVGYGPDELFRLDPYPLLMAGVRVHGERMKIQPVLESLQGRFVFLRDAEPLKRYRLSKQEREVCRMLLGRAWKVEELAQESGIQRQTVLRTVYVLLITKDLQVSEAPPRPSQAPTGQRLDSIAPPPQEDATQDPETAALRKRIKQKASGLAGQSYFEMLGLQNGAEPEAVRKAFFKLAKEYHPDRSSRAGLGDLRETLEYIFANLSEAQGTLIDPDAREEYENAIRDGAKRTSIIPGAKDEDEVRSALDAEKLFQKALVLMRRQAYHDSIALVDKARELNPQEGEYLATWAKLQSLIRSPDSPVDDLVAKLRRAEEQSPKSERIQLFLAQLLKRMGHEAEARTHFERVLEVNPRSIEAAREIRIMEMRRGKEADKQKGFFKRFLK